jgi:probable phosphomutase (TIGR03848 family)
VTRVVLVRHGRTAAVASGVLAGRSPGVALDDVGITQIGELAGRLSAMPITHIVTSPLLRCVESARIILAGRALILARDRRFTECDYGSWTGAELATLARDPLWPIVQAHPSAVTFPGGESIFATQQRAVAGCREWAKRAHDDVGADAILLVVSHGDVIKSVLADALGMHLDFFQRIVIDPGSISVLRYTELRPFVERLNETGSLDTLIGAHGSSKSAISESDAAIGGGAGTASPRR